MQAGKQTVLILFDFSRAFDKDAHENPKFTLLWHQGRNSKLDQGLSDNRKHAVFFKLDKFRQHPCLIRCLQNSVPGPHHENIPI